MYCIYIDLQHNNAGWCVAWGKDVVVIVKLFQNKIRKCGYVYLAAGWDTSTIQH